MPCRRAMPPSDTFADDMKIWAEKESGEVAAET